MQQTYSAIMSYTRFDDEHNRGYLTELARRLSGEIEAQTGEPFPIFQNIDDIRWGEPFEQKIANVIAHATFFIPILTPSFFKSEYCREETRLFIAREQTLQRDDLILPIYYIVTPELEESERRTKDKLAQMLALRQHIDWRELRHESLDTPSVQKLFVQMAVAIARTMQNKTRARARLKPTTKSSYYIERKNPGIESFVTQPNPSFYTIGGTIRVTAQNYIPRQADTALLEAVRKGHFCYVLTPRQIGKSSLMVRTANQLKENGVHSAVVDLTGIGTNCSEEQWYLGQIDEIAEELDIAENYERWWNQRSHLSIVQRFTSFLKHVVLKEITEPIAIFVDEIDSTLKLSYGDDYFAAIRALYNQRAVNPELERLTFVLLGVAGPTELTQDTQRTPFTIGTRIELTDFTQDETSVLKDYLAPNHYLATQLLERIFDWAGGHPYLTQKLCYHVAMWAVSKAWNPDDVPQKVDALVHDIFLGNAVRNTEDHMQMVSKRIVYSPASVKLLQLYRDILQGKSVVDHELDPIKVKLKLSGLVKPDKEKRFIVRNRIYQHAFNERWVENELARLQGGQRANNDVVVPIPDAMAETTIADRV